MIKQYEKYKDSNIKWIGQVPDSWWVSNIRYNAKVVGRIGYRGYTVEDIVDKGEGAISLSPSNIQNQAFDLAKRTYISWEKYEESPEIQVFEGDVILVKTASVGKVAYVDSLKGEKATINPQLVVFKDITMNARFFYYYLISNDFQYQIDRDNYGGVVGTLTQASINSYKILVPSEFEQTKIAQYLEHQTTIIDQLIQQKEKLIELLKEKRQAVINEAVTKGLDPNAKMKDSGIEWLGEVPEHWEVTKMKYMATITRGAILRPVDDPDYFDDNGEWTYLNISDATKCDKYLHEGKLRLSELGSTKSARVLPDNLILTASATIGKPFINKIPVCVHDGFIPITNIKCSIDYLYHYLRNPQLYVALGKVNTQKNIYLDEVKDMFVTQPPLNEQIDIVAFLEKFEETNNELMLQVENQIHKLKEYRQSIISEAVTGKIDVRDWQPNKQQVA